MLTGTAVTPARPRIGRDFTSDYVIKGRRALKGRSLSRAERFGKTGLSVVFGKSWLIRTRKYSCLLPYSFAVACEPPHVAGFSDTGQAALRVDF
jgi:hypothetical protein